VPAHAPLYTKWLTKEDSAEQRIKIVLFSTETRSVVVTQRRFRAHFQTRWAPSLRTINKIYNQFNNDGSVLEGKRAGLHLKRSPEHIDAVSGAAKKPQ
jgi:hypothetical protein